MAHYRGLVQSTTVPERFRGLVEATAELAERFGAVGRALYLVGGSVRDALLSPSGPSGPSDEPPDLDLATEARPDEVERIVRGWADAVWTQGKRFGTIGCRRQGRVYEITTYRAEVYRPDSRKPEVRFGDDLREDLSRRDFTINAMALRVPDMALVDPWDGLRDLAARRLRTPLDPSVAFDDDPLRMLRAARFAAQYQLSPDEELLAAIRSGHERLSIVSAERVRDELDKIVVLAKPSVALVAGGPDRVGPGFPPWNCPDWRSIRTRSTATRTSWRTRWPSSTRRPQTAFSAWPPCSTTSASPGPGRS